MHLNNHAYPQKLSEDFVGVLWIKGLWDILGGKLLYKKELLREIMSLKH